MRLPRLALFGSTVLALAACGGGGNSYTSVGGDVRIEVDGTPTGFTFAQDTRLEDPRVARDDGRIAGFCAFYDGEVVSVGLARTVNTPPEGIEVREVEAQLRPEGGTVSALLGDTQFSATHAECSTWEYMKIGEAIVAIALECELADAGGQLASLTMDVDFEGCERLGAED